MKKKVIGLISMLIVASILGACSSYKFKPTTNYEVSDFTMTNHRGETVTLDDLKGEPWIAMFIFTNCTTICQPMMYNMTVIQEKLVERGIEDYNIIGFSVDPATDTPEVLTEYMSHFSIPDESKWHLLTGYKQEFIEQFSLKSFKTIAKMPQEGDQVIHGSTFTIVDEQGIGVKNYSGYSETEENGVPFDTIAMDMEALIKERLGK